MLIRSLSNDGNVLVFGGKTDAGIVNLLEIFDANLELFHAVDYQAPGRSGHTATVLSDGRVLFLGGEGKGGKLEGKLDVYDPRAKSYAVLPGQWASPRKGHLTKMLGDGRLAIEGGQLV